MELAKVRIATYVTDLGLTGNTYCPAVSMQILQEDVQTLKNGMKTVHLEMKKEPNNFIIFISSLFISL